MFSEWPQNKEPNKEISEWLWDELIIDVSHRQPLRHGRPTVGVIDGQELFSNLIVVENLLDCGSEHGSARKLPISHEV